MFAKPEEFAKAGIETAAFFAATLLDSAERLIALNLGTARTLFEAALSHGNGLLGSRDPQAFINLHNTLTRLTMEKSVDHSRNVYEITAHTKNKLAQAVESRMSDVNNQVNGLVHQALANAPAGSEVAVAAVKSAIAAANEAYDGLNKAARQVAEMAEANLAAVAQAGASAATTAAAKARKAA